MTALIVAVLVGMLAGFGWWAATGWLVFQRRKLVTVHLTDDRTIEGVLWSTARDGLVLDAAVYPHEQERIPLAGRVFVPRPKISFLQVTDAPSDS